MCLDVYIGSNKRLPVIAWNETAPGFYIRETIKEEVLAALSPILKKNFIYNIGSYMGCSCGFSYGDWSRNNEKENHYARVRDTFALIHYLQSNLSDNELIVFGTWWTDFPEEYPVETFSLSHVKEEEFDFIENTILVVNA